MSVAVSPVTLLHTVLIWMQLYLLLYWKSSTHDHFTADTLTFILLYGCTDICIFALAFLWSASLPTDDTWAMMIVWKGRLTELFCAALCNAVVPSWMHAHMSSSYRWTGACWIRLSFYVCVSVHFCLNSSQFVCYRVRFLSVIWLLFGCQHWTSAIDCLVRLVSVVTYYVSSGALDLVQSLTLMDLAVIKSYKCMF